MFVPKWTGAPLAADEVGFPQEILFHTAPERSPPTRRRRRCRRQRAGGPSATETYKNVQVLTDVSAAEFMRLQTAITAWVSPKQGCGFCHAGEDYASDAKPQKRRRASCCT